MSIVRSCIRIAAVAALRDRMWEAAQIFDSDNRPLQDAVTQDPHPYVVVYTDDDDLDDVEGREITGASRSLALVIEFGIAAALEAQPESGPKVAIPATDGAFELVLDSLDAQVMNALVHDSASAFGEHFRQLVARVIKVNGRRGGTAEKGARWAVRQRVFHLDPLIDPAPGQVLDAAHPINQFLNAAEASAAGLDVAGVVPFLRGLLGVTPASSWRLAQQQLGLTKQAVRGIGVAPPDVVLADDKEAPRLARINELQESTIVGPGLATVEGIP